MAGMVNALVQVNVLPEMTGSEIALPPNAEVPVTYIAFAGVLGSVSTKSSSVALAEEEFVTRTVYVGVPPVGHTAKLTNFESVSELLAIPMGDSEAKEEVFVCFTCAPLLMNATGLTGVVVAVVPTTK